MASGASLAYASWNGFCPLVFAECLGLPLGHRHLGWHLLTMDVLEVHSCGKLRASTVLFSGFVTCNLTKAALIEGSYIMEGGNGATSLLNGRSTAIKCVNHMFAVIKSMHR